MSLGETLRNLIEQQGITQKELAAKLSITPSALGNYVQNTREPDYHTLIKIADYFQVSTDCLLGHNAPRQNLSQEEEMLLRIFRSLNDDQREIYLEQGKIFMKQNNKKTSCYSGDKSNTKYVG